MSHVELFMNNGHVGCSCNSCLTGPETPSLLHAAPQSHSDGTAVKTRVSTHNVHCSDKPLDEGRWCLSSESSWQNTGFTLDGGRENGAVLMLSDSFSQSGESKSASISGSLALGDSGEGLSIKGNADNTIAAKSDLKAEEDIVGATINLSNLNESDVRNILETLKPYEHNMKVLTKKDLSAGVGLDSFGLGLKNSTEGLLKSDLSLDSSADLPAVSFNGLSGGLNAEHGVGGKITGPTLNGDLPKVSLNKPSADAGAAVTMPSIGLTGSDIKADIDGLLKTPDVSVSAPQVKIPNASLKVDKPDLKSGEYQSPKLTLPNFKLPKIEPSKTEMDVSGDLDLPSVSGKVDAPNLNLSTPKSSVSGGLNAEHGVGGKITGPTFNGDLPKIPNASLKVGKPNLKSGKNQSPKFKMPNFQLPKIEPPETEMDVSGDLDLPSVSGKVDAPNLNLSTPKSHFNKPNPEFNEPNVNLNEPDLKFEAPNADIEGPSGKIKWPHLKWKSPKVRGPDTDLDAEISVPDANVPMAKVDGDLDVGIDFPKAHIKGPEVDVDSPSGKINWPHLKWKKPRFHGSKDSLDIDASIDPADANLSLPKVKGEFDPPDVDINLPKADIKGPDLDVQTPELDIESTAAPKIEGEIHTPDLHLKAPKTQLQSQKLDLNAKLPNTELEAPDVTIKSPNLDTNQPKLALKAPDGQIKTPDLELDPVLGDFKMPHFKVPALDLSSPNAGIEAPKVNLNNPTADASISVPAVELNGPKVEGPKVDINAPDVAANVEKSRFPHFKLPKFSFLGPKLKTEEVNASGSDGDDNNDDDDASNIETDVPIFRLHSLPKSTFDGFGDVFNAFGLSKCDDEEQDFVVRKGIKLPVSNTATAAGKIDIMQILKLSKEKPSSVSEMEDANLRLAAPSLDVSASAEAEDSSLGTLKIEKPGSVEGSADENQRLSQGLANMLCLGSDDPDTV
ncbi:hypothetical protein CCH79_00018817 [Gambusia affinis]|uniref:Uncharacterized protein n=1 Tax=Gambusia affinis TaxID=33528 RepID=A0A315VDY1_GAMAF|nr:hypothetical protein CCH79_00018817 [Gambusia affinis]